MCSIEPRASAAHNIDVNLKFRLFDSKYQPQKNRKNTFHNMRSGINLNSCKGHEIKYTSTYMEMHTKIG